MKNIRAIFENMKISFAKKLLDEYDISYEEWTFFDNIELRIEICELSEKQLQILVDNFGEEIKDYDYFIIWD
jgi:hypothetical protein